MNKLVFLTGLIILFIRLEAQDSGQPYVIMLSMDGFRWDYTNDVETPNFDSIERVGVKAESLKSCFPTKTFPNHYSMATGLFPDHHGIVLNSFYDEEMDRHYSLMDRKSVQEGKFYGGEPIWVSAEKQGIITGTLFWVGSEAEIKGTRPTYWKQYDHDLPYVDRIDTVISWLQKPEEFRPRLILFYFDEPDGIGHKYGPESPKEN